MYITPLTSPHIPAAAALFTRGYRRLRQSVPSMPERMASDALIAEMLAGLLDQSYAFGAFEGETLLGYLGGWVFDGFRGTPRRAVYIPEWAHGVLVEANADRVYRGLYRAAATRWFADGVQVQAITLLSDDQAAREAWFWNGFGLHVVDGMRPMGPIHAPQPAGYRVRKAEVADAEMVAAIEAEHWTHYAKPPVLMMTNAANTAEECAALIRNPENSFWLALGEDAQPAGYMRFEASIDGGAAVLEGEGGVGITGAYVRPAHRGRGLSPALLDAALCDYAARGYLRCAVDFESFNPEAAAFWPKYFQLVTYSLVRIPEREPEKI